MFISLLRKGLGVTECHKMFFSLLAALPPTTFPEKFSAYGAEASPPGALPPADPLQFYIPFF
jgi:hypothetical protein